MLRLSGVGIVVEIKGNQTLEPEGEMNFCEHKNPVCSDCFDEIISLERRLKIAEDEIEEAISWLSDLNDSDSKKCLLDHIISADIVLQTSLEKLKEGDVG